MCHDQPRIVGIVWVDTVKVDGVVGLWDRGVVHSDLRLVEYLERLCITAVVVSVHISISGC